MKTDVKNNLISLGILLFLLNSAVVVLSLVTWFFELDVKEKNETILICKDRETEEIYYRDCIEKPVIKTIKML